MGFLKKQRSVLFAVVAVIVCPVLALAGGEGGEAHHVNLLMEAFRVINFVVFAVLLYKFVGQPVRNYFRNRLHGIELALKEAREAKEEAQRKSEEYAERLKNADAELKEVFYRAEKERDEQMRRIGEETDKMVKRILEQTEAAADLEVKKSKLELQKEAADLAVSMAETILKENFSDEDQKRMIKDYADKLREVH